jgi:hypothetical protein
MRPIAVPVASRSECALALDVAFVWEPPWAPMGLVITFASTAVRARHWIGTH